MDGSFDTVQQLVSPFLTSTNRNTIVAITTLYINYAVLLQASAPDHDTDRAVTLLNDIVNILGSVVDAEALYRALVAAGTLLSLGKDFRDLAREALDFDDVLKKVKSGKAGAEPRVKAVIAEMTDETS
jgi:phospholipase A-2-activating protein